MLSQLSPRFRSEPLSRAISFLWMGLLAMGILSSPFFSYPGRDGGIFLYVGSLILKGRIPYLEVWENKGPLVFYINALGLALSGGSRWGVWFLEFLFFFCAGVLGYIVIKCLMGGIPALVGTFIWTIAAGNVLQGGNFSEEYSLLFSFIALFGFWKSLEHPQKNFYVLLVGISLGLNILLRPNNISMQAGAAGAYLILALFSKEWRIFFKRVLWYAIGVLVVIVPVILYFFIQGALTEMINVVLVFNFQYSDGINPASILDGLMSASRAIGVVYVAIAILGYGFSLWVLFKNRLNNSLDKFLLILLIGWPIEAVLSALSGRNYLHYFIGWAPYVTIAILGYGFSLWALFKNRLNNSLDKFLLILLIGWPIEAVLSALSGRNYLHYFIGWAPYVGLLCGYVVYLLLRQFAPNSDRYSIFVLLALIGVTLVSNMTIWKNYGVVLAQIGSAELDYRDPVALYIMENTSPQDKVFVWGFRPIINFVSGRESPVSFLPYPLIHVDTPLGNHWADQFYSQLTTDPPALIVNVIEPADRERIPDLDPIVRKEYKIKRKEVVLAPNLQDTLDFIEQNYVRIESVNGYDIYRLKTSIP